MPASRLPRTGLRANATVIARLIAVSMLLGLLGSGGCQLPQEPVATTVRVTGPTLDLKKFGARGDGVHNDTAAFRAAADAIQRAGGGRLIIPPGTYIVGEQIHEEGQFPYYRDQPILTVHDVDGLIIEGRGAILRLAPGLRYGSFDKETGEPFTPEAGGFYDRAYAVGVGSMLQISRSRNVLIRDLELDGNSGALVLGGMWGDTGRQLTSSGIVLYNNADVQVSNVHTHHHGLDGIMIGYSGLKESDPPTPHTLVKVRSEYNGRQGLSWVGGRGLKAYRCQFNHMQRGAVASAPGSGLDIEAEESVCREGYFEDCEFINNGGCAMVADSGDGGYTRFVRCIFWGVSNWSTWSAKPGLVYEDCTFHGTAVHGFGSSDAALATRYIGCTFEDKDYGDKGVYRSTGGLVECGGGDNILYDGCTFRANQTRSFWIDGGGTREIVRGCAVMHRVDRATGDFLALMRGVQIESTHFREEYPPGTAARYYIEAQGVTIGADVVVDGPICKWANWSWGTTGVIRPTEPQPPTPSAAGQPAKSVRPEEKP